MCRDIGARWPLPSQSCGTGQEVDLRLKSIGDDARNWPDAGDTG
jgi:hypothetical protein